MASVTFVLFAFLAIAATFVDLASASKITNYAYNRTTLVHLFEWKWNDIAEECERFLGPVGYAGVQVSPIEENVIMDRRPWYERYQPISYRWLTRSGNEQEFRSMVRRCSKVGVRVYVDVVFNHMSGNHVNAMGTGGARADTWQLSYPSVPYDRQHFHPICIVNDYQNATNVRNCELNGLHDLDQAQEYVRTRIVDFLNGAIEAGVAGFRVDAAKHMWPEDLKVIYSRIKNVEVSHNFKPGTRPYIFQEVIDYGGEAISKYEYNKFAGVTEFKFGSEISSALRGRNLLKWFVNWGQAWGLLPSEDALVFIDNHDTQRNDGDVPLTFKTPKLYKIAVAFMLAHPYGQPRVMSSFGFQSYEQGPPADAAGNILSPTIQPDNTCGNGWICEHRWREIYNMVGFRNYVGRADLTGWWDNGANQIAFCRGNRGFVAINADREHLRRRLHVCLPPGIYCDVISGEARNGRCTGKSIRVDESRNADIEIRTDEFDGVVAFHAGAKIA